MKVNLKHLISSENYGQAGIFTRSVIRLAISIEQSSFLYHISKNRKLAPIRRYCINVQIISSKWIVEEIYNCQGLF